MWRDACDQPFKEVLGVLLDGPVVRHGEGELARAVYGDEQVELAFLGARLSDVDVEKAYGVFPELLPRAYYAFGARQTTDSVSVQTAMQRGPRKMRDRLLQGVQAVVKGKKGVFAEGDDYGLLLNR